MKNCLQGNKWTFDNTFLFVGSVATTIGFGNVTPKTISGQVLCIAFAIVRNWFEGLCRWTSYTVYYILYIYCIYIYVLYYILYILKVWLFSPNIMQIIYNSIPMFGILLSRINTEIDLLITNFQIWIQTSCKKHSQLKSFENLLNRNTIKVG